MNVKAALKAAGVYLAGVAVVAAWVVGIVLAALSRSEGWIYVAAFAPIWLLAAAGFVFVVIVEPTTALYKHFDKAARR